MKNLVFLIIVLTLIQSCQSQSQSNLEKELKLSEYNITVKFPNTPIGGTKEYPFMTRTMYSYSNITENRYDDINLYGIDIIKYKLDTFLTDKARIDFTQNINLQTLQTMYNGKLIKQETSSMKDTKYLLETVKVSVKEIGEDKFMQSLYVCHNKAVIKLYAITSKEDNKDPILLEYYNSLKLE